jgi:integrase
VLEVAVEYGHLENNPARGKRRRLPVSKKPRPFLDAAEGIAALLDAASALDEGARRRRGQRRALLATLVLAGLRIGEALDLRWMDVNPADGKLKIRDAKTAAGVRIVDVLLLLRDELLSYKLGLGDVELHARVFATSTGGRNSETNVRRRILAPAVSGANEALLSHGREMLPERLTPHSLRLGHTDPALTLRIYAHDMARGEHERARLRAVVEGRECGTLWDRTQTDEPAASSTGRS